MEGAKTVEQVLLTGATGFVGQNSYPILRQHGYPTSHSAAQIDDDHLAADMVIAMGRNHARFLKEMGVPPERLRMMRSFDPRSGAFALDVEDPYYGSLTDFQDVFDVIDASLGGLHEWVDERLGSER